MQKILIGLAAVAVLTACDDSEPVGPNTEAGTLTVDASQGWAYVAFEDGEATVVNVTDPSGSDDWDMAFNAFSVMLNGGAAGPGGVAGYCLCQNASATDAQVMDMTPASELADFDAVTSATLPTGGEWTEESFVAAIDGWYMYDFGTHTVLPAPGNVFAVRSASGTSFAKLHVIAIEGATQAHAGTVTLEYAYQTAAGGAFRAPDTVQLDASVGERLELESGTVSTTGDWDVALEGWDFRTNSGVSGSGAGGAFLTEQTFAEVTDAGEAPSVAFSRDAYAGVFGDHPWFRYNLDGFHTVFPTFDVYLIDTGDAVYKVQLTGYYSASGDPRFITIRYEQLD